MILRSRILILLFLAALIAPVLAQQTPARTVPAPPPSSGTASISGVVVGDDAAGQPLRRVTLSLLPATSGFPAIQRMTTTDDRGRFIFTALPAGNYSSLSARKAGFVPMTYGQKRVNGMGMPISLTDGQQMTVDLKLTRAAVITGTLFDQGRPAVQVSVQATAVKIANGQRTASSSYVGSVSTDDRGVYRIYGLAPGDYVVAANPRMSTGADLRPITDAELQWGRQQIQPGSLNAAAGATASPASNAPPRPAAAVAYSPVFYPGTATLASAGIVTVAAGQEQGGVDFSLTMVETAKIEGTVVSSDGQTPQNVQINMVPKTLNDSAVNDLFMLDMLLMSRPTVSNGKFAIPAVRPGDYTIVARAARGGAAAPSGPPAGGRGAPAPMTLWATADISVNGIDQSGIELRLQEGMDLTGKVVFDATTLQPPADLSRISIRLGAAPTAGVTVSVNSPTAQPAADGTFTLQGVTPGRYFLSASVPGGTPGQSWMVRSAKVGDIDAADFPFEIAPGQNVTDVVITFTDKSAELSGTLLDANGKPTPEFSILLFPADKVMWSQRSRRLRSPTRPAADGKFKFTNLLPGDYYLAALTDFEPQDVYKPEFLEQVAPVALKITIAEGEKKVQDLKIGGGN